MKLGKEEIKKIALSFCVLTALLYVYFTLLLGPLKANQEKAASGITTLEPQIADATEQVKKTAELEKKAPVATKALTDLKATIPDGAPIAWFPPRITSFFKRHGIDKCTAKLMSEGPEASLPGFRRLVWAVEIPQAEFVPFGMAVASLENEEPLLRVLNVSVEAARENAQYQHCVLTVATLVKS